jgi:thioredoxin reductase (NADPH)
MLDYDAVIIGGGPAGLTAGAAMSRAGCRTVLLERELFGGNLKNVEQIDGAGGEVSGAQLASDLAAEASRSGLRLLEASAAGIEAFSSTRWVALEDGRGYSAAVVVVATGTRFRKLGVPGEERFVGRGVIDCVPCDGGFFIERRVAVFGAGDHAVAEALYLAGLAARVTIVAPGPDLVAAPDLRERALRSPRIEVRHGASLEEVIGTDRVTAVSIVDVATGASERLELDGVVIRVGSQPNTEFLEGLLDLDPAGLVPAGRRLETAVTGVLAAGDVRAGSPMTVAAAVEDGTAAARRAVELLAELARAD